MRCNLLLAESKLIESGTLCLILFVNLAPAALASASINQVPVLQALTKTVGRLLDPVLPDTACAVLGSLLFPLISKFQDKLGPQNMTQVCVTLALRLAESYRSLISFCLMYCQTAVAFDDRSLLRLQLPASH
jgi:hypothetical protein